MSMWSKVSEASISIFKYLLAVYMMLAGVATALSNTGGVNPKHLDFIFNTKISLITFGVIFFVSGAILLYGKIRRSRYWTGKGLLLIYLCFTFVTILDIAAFGFLPLSQWLSNAGGVIIVGALWLRWKFKTEYINPKHFTDIPRRVTYDERLKHHR